MYVIEDQNKGFTSLFTETKGDLLQFVHCYNITSSVSWTCYTIVFVTSLNIKTWSPFIRMLWVKSRLYMYIFVANLRGDLFVETALFVNPQRIRNWVPFQGVGGKLQDLDEHHKKQYPRPGHLPLTGRSYYLYRNPMLNWIIVNFTKLPSTLGPSSIK